MFFWVGKTKNISLEFSLRQEVMKKGVTPHSSLMLYIFLEKDLVRSLSLLSAAYNDPNEINNNCPNI